MLPTARPEAVCFSVTSEEVLFDQQRMKRTVLGRCVEEGCIWQRHRELRGYKMVDIELFGVPAVWMGLWTAWFRWWKSCLWQGVGTG